eukprot:TRINITY_DN16963_c0_g1_i1.p1 TRINITY_DN16963_c0_g1~~TRINITY_DN16963_c0_g1_i1.p1  ORF type:complete len:178 (-),score=13.49 TRINITY_DN16963_c0_g1_i1:80-613(-)
MLLYLFWLTYCIIQTESANDGAPFSGEDSFTTFGNASAVLELHFPQHFLAESQVLSQLYPVTSTQRSYHLWSWTEPGPIPRIIKKPYQRSMLRVVLQRNLKFREIVGDTKIEKSAELIWFGDKFAKRFGKRKINPNTGVLPHQRVSRLPGAELFLMNKVSLAKNIQHMKKIFGDEVR